jgi:hypothetical protein
MGPDCNFVSSVKRIEKTPLMSRRRSMFTDLDDLNHSIFARYLSTDPFVVRKDNIDQNLSMARLQDHPEPFSEF